MPSDPKHPGELGFDASTLHAARSGDRDALGSIWLELNPKVVRFARSLGVSEPDDLASQVWIEVAGGFDRIGDEPDAFVGLVFTIVRRRCIDAARRRQRRPTDPLEDHQATQPHHTPIDDAISLLDAEALLRRLDPAVAELVALRVIVGLSNAEIAAMTGRTEGAVRVTTHRALRHLRSLLAPNEFPVTPQDSAAMECS